MLLTSQNNAVYEAHCDVLDSEFFNQPSWRTVVVACVLAMFAWTAKAQAPQVPANLPGTAGIDASGNTQQERSACLNGQTQQDQATCLREANNAAQDKNQGKLTTEGPLGANAVRRCEPLAADDRAACEARILGAGSTNGSVAGGGVIRQVETVEVPPGASSITIRKQTDGPVLVVPAPR
ncbi:hypothetical protein [Variovorax sp. HJSM1_2]|uniref:hypothetical protein n=1 Tax=Variovorax sp. HJSM1_2 TaxID=3366263 RepID=UPI003BC6E498